MPHRPWHPRAQLEQGIEDSIRLWGKSGKQEENLARGSPDMSEDERNAFVRVLRLSVSPGAAADYMRMNLDVDVCGVLDSIRVPTLVLHRRDCDLDVRSGRYLAEHIPGARLVEVQHHDRVVWHEHLLTLRTHRRLRLASTRAE